MASLRLPESDVGVSETPFVTFVETPADDSGAFLITGEAGAGAPVDLQPLREQSASLEVSGGRTEACNRAFDILTAVLLVLFLLPLMIACAAAVRCSGPGPLIFRHRRIGRRGEEFLCLKFRTMQSVAESSLEDVLRSSKSACEQWNALYKLRQDPRTTSVGRFLRRYSLDELPQLFNVLAGEMSVVGPRPIVAAEVVRYGANFADYCSVKPGLTGLWQVSGRHSVPYEERVRLDALYANTKSVAMDILILLRTVPVVLMGKNE